jgi:uncharacterized protein (UPF0303 family)
MADGHAERIAAFEEQERELVFPSFDHEDAWLIGSALRAQASEAGHPIAIDIRRPSGAVLFHAALPGATADQGEWIRRKSALVFRLEASSALVAQRLDAAGFDAFGGAWLDPTQYAAAGGSFPVRVSGAGIVATLTISGLSSDADHELAESALRAHLNDRSH